MSTQHLETDYLVLGAGATGMAFADVVLAEDPTAHLVVVDRRAKPGGHWNDAYPYVRLHQPAAYYGLHSTPLGRGGGDLASGAEVVAYYEQAMDRFVRTGRLRFLSSSEHRGDGRVVSLVDPGHVTTVTARRRVVDCTYVEVEVPSLRPPPFAVDGGVAVVPPGGVAQVREPYERYVVVGAGKTGVDAVLFLLEQGVAPERVQWVVSNDAWLWSRESVQPDRVLGTLVSMLRSATRAATVDEAFLRLEEQGIVTRVDPGRRPSKWRCATVDGQELERLRSVDDVVRLGRVQRVEAGRMHLDGGAVKLAERSLLVDCTANGLASAASRPVFSDGRITVQSVFMCQQTFSAAFLAHLELLDLSDDQRNRTATPVPNPQLAEHLPDGLLISAQNLVRAGRHAPLWLRRTRLNMAQRTPLHRYVVGVTRVALLQRRGVGPRDAVSL